MEIGAVIRLLKWPLAGFFVALVGGVLNVLGWYVFDSRTVALVGFVVCAGGVGFGIVAMLVGQAVVLSDLAKKRRESKK